MHEDGFKLAISREMRRYADDHEMLKKEEAFTRDDTLEGLTCIVSIKHPNPQFEGQTKTKLGNPEVRAITSQIAGEAIRAYLLENPNDAKVIIEKIILASRARIAARKAREATRRKNPLDNLGFASKLADCRNKNLKNQKYLSSKEILRVGPLNKEEILNSKQSCLYEVKY